MIARLHYITQDHPEFSHVLLAERACQAGADWVQLRMKPGKSTPIQDILSAAGQVKQICRHFGAQLIINDQVEIAKEIGADGVHLGRSDMSPAEARKILGPEFIIGGSSNTMKDVQQLIQMKVDYIGIGPYRFTSTKKDLNPVLGLEGIRKIIQQSASSIPFIAIGGILPADVPGLRTAGAYGVAVSSAINMASDPRSEINEFRKGLEE